VKAFERYLQTRDPDVVEVLSQPGPALPAVRALVEAYAEESLCDERRRGCMVVNAAVEVMPRDPQIARRVEASWDTVETAGKARSQARRTRVLWPVSCSS